MKIIHTAILLAGLSAVSQAHALDIDSDRVSIRGFGSVGITQSSFSDADFVTDGAIPDGAGRTDETSFSSMSRIGIQVDGQFNEQWSAAIQALSEYNYEGNYAPSIPFAYIKYKPVSSTTLRAGRLTNPIYMLTDYARVGYALPWARPPLEMYRNYPLFEGVDVSTQFSASDVAYSLQAIYGLSSTYKLAGDGGDTITLKNEPLWGLILTADVGSTTLRLGHIQSKAEFDSNGIDGMIAAYQGTPANAAFMAKYDPNGNITNYDVIGLSYDPGKWFLRTEYAAVSWKDKTIFPSYNTGYLSLGYRYGAFTPYAIYGWYKMDSDTSDASDPIGYINGALAATDGSRHSTSVGVRWDFMDSMDLKVQFSRVESDSDTSNMGLTNTNYAPGASAPSSYDVVFAGIDFVF